MLAVLLLLASFTSIHAQQTTGSIVGTVKDQTGAAVNTASVKATNVDTGFSRVAPTNGYGEYRIDYLPVGKYTVEVEAKGFERFVQQSLTPECRPNADNRSRPDRRRSVSDGYRHECAAAGEYI